MTRDTKHRIGWAAAALLVLVTFSATPGAGADLQTTITASIDRYNTLTAVPIPRLDAAALDGLTRGEVIKIRRQLEPDATGDRKSIVCYYLCDEPRDHVWVAAIDDHFTGSDRLIEYRIDADDQGGGTWYQHLDLPWPLQDRHWVIHTRKGVELARATAGSVWEHAWQLAPDGERLAAEVVAAGKADGLKPKDVKSAVYLPANTGAWVMFALDDHRSLIVYHVTTVVGGSIPDSWIATFAYPQLDSLMRGVVAFARDIVRHYDAAGHPIVYSGAGEPIVSLR